METYTQDEQRLIEKVRQLPLEKILEVEDFIDFISQRQEDHYLTQSFAKLSEPILANIWDNPNDAEYDNL